MSMFQETATVTSTFSLNRSRPVLRWTSLRAASSISCTRPTRRPR